ncbi:MAG: hypothetical protein AAFP77_06335 [Bacteroidota bacterium]
MCNYVFNGENKSPCQVQEYLDLNQMPGLEIPLDSDGLCVFHSKDIDWKRKNNFQNHLNRLIESVVIAMAHNEPKNEEKKAVEIDFRGFVFIGEDNTVDIPLSNITSSTPISIFLEQCTFLGNLRLANVEWPKCDAIFNDSSFEGSIELNDVSLKNFSFDGCEITKDFSIIGCSLFDCFQASKMNVGGDVFIENTYFELSASFDELNLIGAFNLVSSQFYDVFSLSNCLLHGEVDFFSCEFFEEVIIQDSIFKNTVEFIGNRYRGTFSLISSNANEKVFHDIVYFTINSDNDVSGTILFENINLNYINERDRRKLIDLSYGHKVDIGGGCIKYRLQSPVITVQSGNYTHNIVEELSRSFANYFIYSQGITLGVEFVDKRIDQIQLFYYTDENITIEEFYKRLKITQHTYWKFSMKDDAEVIPVDNMIGLIDAYISKTSVLSKIQLRSNYDLWKKEDSEKILQAVSFGDNKLDGDTINIHIENLKIESGLSIENQSNYGGSHQFGDKIDNK